MSDPWRDLSERLAKIDRRLHALATAPRANRTAVRNGFTRWLATNDGDYPNVRIGSTADTDGDPALTVNEAGEALTAIYLGTNAGRARFDLYNRDKSGLVLSFDDGALRAPSASCAWQRFVGTAMDGVGMSTTTSATYVDMWYAVLTVGDDEVNTVIDVVPDGGTTGSVRVMAQAIGGVSTGKVPAASAQQVVEQTGITTSTVVQGPWTIPEAIWNPASNVAGTIALLTIQGLRSAGGGSVHVAPRWPVWVP